MSDDSSTTLTPPMTPSSSPDLYLGAEGRGGVWIQLPLPGIGQLASTDGRTCSMPSSAPTSAAAGRFAFVQKSSAKPLDHYEQDLKNLVAKGHLPSEASEVKPGGLADLKAGAGGKKPPLHQWPPAPLNWGARVGQYGGVKYHDGNYMRGPASGTDLDRLLDYVSAAQRHLAAWANSILRFKGGARGAAATEQEACYGADDESGLPHGGHALASLYMGIQQAVDAGLVPADPGITWEVVDGALRRKP